MEGCTYHSDDSNTHYPISREASRQDALETARRMMGAAQTEPSLVQGTSLGVMTSEASPLSLQRTAHSEGPTTIPVGRAEPMSSNLIWPGHPNMAGNSLCTMDLEPTTIRTDSQERLRLLHPYELERSSILQLVHLITCSGWPEVKNQWKLSKSWST